MICKLLFIGNYRLANDEKTCVKQFTYEESTEIRVPLNKITIGYLFLTYTSQVALACYSGSINNHYPKDPTFKTF